MGDKKIPATQVPFPGSRGYAKALAKSKRLRRPCAAPPVAAVVNEPKKKTKAPTFRRKAPHFRIPVHSSSPPGIAPPSPSTPTRKGWSSTQYTPLWDRLEMKFSFPVFFGRIVERKASNGTKYMRVMRSASGLFATTIPGYLPFVAGCSAKDFKDTVAAFGVSTAAFVVEPTPPSSFSGVGMASVGIVDEAFVGDNTAPPMNVTLSMTCVAEILAKKPPPSTLCVEMEPEVAPPCNMDHEEAAGAVVRCYIFRKRDFFLAEIEKLARVYPHLLSIEHGAECVVCRDVCVAGLPKKLHIPPPTYSVHWGGGVNWAFPSVDERRFVPKIWIPLAKCKNHFSHCLISAHPINA